MIKSKITKIILMGIVSVLFASPFSVWAVVPWDTSGTSTPQVSPPSTPASSNTTIEGLNPTRFSDVMTSTTIRVTDNDAVLSGRINPKGKDTLGYFRYSSRLNIPPVFCNDIYGSDMKSTKEVSIGSGSSYVSFAKTVSNLEPNTIYYYCAVGSSETEIKYGDVFSFTTGLASSGTATMSITTNQPLVINSSSVYINGSYNSNVDAETWFEYRKVGKGEVWSEKINNQNYGKNTAGNLSFLLVGLSPSTTYEFRAAIRSNPGNTILYGNALPFKTLEATDNSGGTDYSGNYNNGNSNNSGANNGNTNQKPLTLGEKATPPADATVHYREGIETVLARQVVANTQLAKIYGYQTGDDLQSFAWNLADVFARVFGYVNSKGKEIRVSVPDMAAYQLQLSGKKLTVYEYYNGKIVNIQKITDVVRNAHAYEYYFNK